MCGGRREHGLKDLLERFRRAGRELRGHPIDAKLLVPGIRSLDDAIAEEREQVSWCATDPPGFVPGVVEEPQRELLEG